MAQCEFVGCSVGPKLTQCTNKPFPGDLAAHVIRNLQAVGGLGRVMDSWPRVWVEPHWHGGDVNTVGEPNLSLANDLSIAVYLGTCAERAAQPLDKDGVNTVPSRCQSATAHRRFSPNL
jgi:hypothetical protein